jgi:threonine/homoserine/homoserine lactone efflux protein
MAFMLGQTVRNGRKVGSAALSGSLVATYFHIAMAAIGLSVVIATSAIAFSIIKWAGFIYLIWLGYQAIFSSGKNEPTTESKPPKTSSVFLQGALISALNPKVAIFFLAFLPQFVVEGAGPVTMQLLLHGSLMVVFGFLLQTPLILMESRIASTLKKKKNIGRWSDRCLGALYVSLGIRLAISKMN